MLPLPNPPGAFFHQFLLCFPRLLFLFAMISMSLFLFFFSKMILSCLSGCFVCLIFLYLLYILPILCFLFPASAHLFPNIGPSALFSLSDHQTGGMPQIPSADQSRGQAISFRHSDAFPYSLNILFCFRFQGYWCPSGTSAAESIFWDLTFLVLQTAVPPEVLSDTSQ